MTLQGHRRSLILAPIESTYILFLPIGLQQSTVTLVRSCPFPEILPFVDQNPPLPCPTPIPVKTSWSYLNITGQTWIGLCSVLRPLQHSIGYMGDGVYRSKDPTNSIKVLKENLQRKKHKKHKENRKYTHTQNSIQITVTQTNTSSPLVYNNMGVSRGQLPQRAGSLGLNGGGTAAAVPPHGADRWTDGQTDDLL